MITKTANFKTVSHVIGIILLWTSIIYFAYGASGDSYTHFATVTAIPFAVCTVITFVGRYIKMCWRKVIEWMDKY